MCEIQTSGWDCRTVPHVCAHKRNNFKSDSLIEREFRGESPQSAPGYFIPPDFFFG